MKDKLLAQIRNRKLNRKTVKFVAVLVLAILLAFPPLANLYLPQAHAAFSNAKVTINNSQAGATGVTYEVRVTASVNTAIKDWKVVFCTTASGSCTEPPGMSTTGAVKTVDNISTTSPTDTFTSDGTLERSSSDTTVQSPLGIIYTVRGITNPSTANSTFYARVTSYSDQAGTLPIDTLTVAMAVLDTNSIAVSATVDPNFTFTVTRAVTGRVNGNYSGSDAINVSTTTNNSIPFGSLNTSTASVSAHDITITTNASNGYEVTASSSAVPPLQHGADNIDSFSGTNAVPTNWSSPAGGTPSVNTGYFGYTTSSNSLCTGTANRFTDNSSYQKYAGFDTLGGEVACSTSPKSSDTTRVGWKLEINSIQPAGAYTGSIILVATPTY